MAYSIKKILAFFIIGFAVFSPLCSVISNTVLGLPISAPELIIIIIVYIFRKELKSLRIPRNEFVSSLMIILVGITIGLVAGYYSFYGIISVARSWLYVILFYKIFKKSNLIDSEGFMWIALGSMIAWFVTSFLNFGEMVKGSLGAGELLETYGLMLAFPLYFTFHIKNGNKLMISVGILLSILIFLTSGIRRVIIPISLSLILPIFIIIIEDRKRITRLLLMAIITSWLLYLLIPYTRRYVEEASPVMYYRIFTRFDSYYDGTDSGSDSDKVRAGNFVLFADNLAQYTMPKGFFSVKSTDNHNKQLFAPFYDFPFVQLCWIIGWPFAFLLYGYFVAIIFRNIKKYRRVEDNTSLVESVCLINLLAFLFLEGTFLLFPDFSPLTGAILGKGVLNSKTKYVLL